MLNSFSCNGRLTADPEITKTKTGISSLKIRVACTREVKQGDKYPTDFINVQVWRGAADYISSHAHKGDLVSVHGRIATDSYKNRSGDTVYTWQVNADSIDIVSYSKANKNAGPDLEAADQASFVPPSVPDTIGEPLPDFNTGPSLDISSNDLPF